MVYKKAKSPLKDKISGNYFYPITTIDQIIVNDYTRLNNYSIIKNQLINTTLVPSKWFGEEPPYTQFIIIEGMSDMHKVDVRPIYLGDLKNDLIINNALKHISYALHNYDIITFYCLNNKPDCDIPIEIEVNV